MEDDDHDELLNCTDDESMSESEDQCLPVDKQDEPQTKQQSTNSPSTLCFLLTKITLIISSTFLIVLFPLYLESVNVKGNAYAMIFFSSFVTLVFLLIALIISKSFCPKYKFITIWKPPLPWKEMMKIAVLYTLSGLIITYALDRKRVMCHLQDPIKGIILVYSLIYYFFFCKKLMGLQRIFSSTIIIVGLFISVDYGLCDEFKCRGYERAHRSDDAGTWKWPINSIWGGIYIIGLGLFAGYFTLLDRYVLPPEMAPIQTTVTASLLTTISRIVSFQNGQFLSETRPLNSLQRNRSPRSYLHLGFWVHLISFVLVVAMFWIDIIPNIGKSESLNDFFNKTLSGISCHFTSAHFSGPKPEYYCANVSLFSWFYILTLLTFTLTSIAFLLITQSAVYTVATMSASLPFVGVWWSLFRMSPVEAGLIQWAPSVSGELICALLGLPIVLIGLILLCKCHLKDSQLIKENQQHHNLPSHFA